MTKRWLKSQLFEKQGFLLVFFKINNCTATAIAFIYSFSGNSAASAPISLFMCLWAIYMYIPRISLHISSSQTGRPIVGIYNSLTDTWMWKLGLRPRYSFLWEYLFQIFGILSLQCGKCAYMYIRFQWKGGSAVFSRSEIGSRHPKKFTFSLESHLFSLK